MAKKPVKIDADLMHKIADRLAIGETLKDIPDDEQEDSKQATKH
jgi:hypothetical protein